MKRTMCPHRLRAPWAVTLCLSTTLFCAACEPALNPQPAPAGTRAALLYDLREATLQQHQERGLTDAQFYELVRAMGEDESTRQPHHHATLAPEALRILQGLSGADSTALADAARRLSTIRITAPPAP